MFLISHNLINDAQELGYFSNIVWNMRVIQASPRNRRGSLLVRFSSLINPHSSYMGITSAFQAEDAGSIPVTRSNRGCSIPLESTDASYNRGENWHRVAPVEVGVYTAHGAARSRGKFC